MDRRHGHGRLCKGGEDTVLAIDRMSRRKQATAGLERKTYSPDAAANL